MNPKIEKKLKEARTHYSEYFQRYEAMAKEAAARARTFERIRQNPDLCGYDASALEMEALQFEREIVDWWYVQEAHVTHLAEFNALIVKWLKKAQRQERTLSPTLSIKIREAKAAAQSYRAQQKQVRAAAAKMKSCFLKRWDDVSSNARQQVATFNRWSSVRHDISRLESTAREGEQPAAQLREMLEARDQVLGGSASYQLDMTLRAISMDSRKKGYEKQWAHASRKKHLAKQLAELRGPSKAKKILDKILSELTPDERQVTHFFEWVAGGLLGALGAGSLIGSGFPGFSMGAFSS